MHDESAFLRLLVKSVLEMRKAQIEFQAGANDLNSPYLDHLEKEVDVLLDSYQIATTFNVPVTFEEIPLPPIDWGTDLTEPPVPE